MTASFIKTGILYLGLLAGLAFSASAQTWQTINANVPGKISGNNVHIIASDGTRLYVLGDRGVFMSPDNGDSFTPINDIQGGSYGLTNMSYRFLKYANGYLWIGSDPGSGAINNGYATLHRLAAGQTVWEKCSTGFPVGDTGNQADDIAYDSSTGTYYVAAALGGAFVSTDGLNWQQRTTGLGGIGVPSSIVAYNGMAFILRPLAQVYQTTNQGTNWTALNSHQGISSGYLLEKNGRIMFASSGNNSLQDSFNFSDDNGATWRHTIQLRGTADLSEKDGIIYAAGVCGGIVETVYGRYGLKFSATAGITWDNLPTNGLPIDSFSGINTFGVIRQGNYLFTYYNVTGTNYLSRCDISGFDFTPSTQIATPPTALPSTNRLVGQPFALNVLAGGTNLTYQWRLNGTNISGATGTTYNVAAATTNDGGAYTVVVTGDRGSVTSTVSTVRVGLRTDGRADITYVSPGTGSGSQLYLLPDDSILTVNGATLIKLNPDGVRIQTNTFAGSTFSTGFLDSSNRLLLVNSSGAYRLRRINVTNLLDDPGFTQLTANLAINAVTEMPGRGYLVAGGFSSVTNAGVSTNALRGMCLIGYDGLVNTNFNIGDGPGTVARVVVDSGTNIFALGNWTFWNADYELSGCVKLKSDGSRDFTFTNPGMSSSRLMVSLAPGRLLTEDPNGRLIVMDPNGVRDNTFNAANHAFNFASAIASVVVGESNKIYVAGNFSSYGGTNAGRYLRLLPDGSMDASFYTEAPAGGGFAAMVYDPRGYLHLMRNNSSGAFQGQSFGFGPYRVFAGMAGDNGAPPPTGFDAWTQQYTFPSGQSHPQDDADGDGVPNIFEFYFGSNPTNAASGSKPSGLAVNVGGLDYPALRFIRSQTASGVTLLPQVSSTVNFTDNLGYTIDSVVDLGNGTEQVTIRSNVGMAARTAQFLRIQLSVP